MEIQHPVWLAQQPSLGHQPIGIRLSRKPTWRPDRGQRPIEIRRFLEIGLESGSSRSTPVEHPRTFLRPQHPQHHRFWTNQNSERRFDPDHPEFWGVYKSTQPSIQQDSAHRLRRDSFSGSGLSSPALQRSHRDSFSESPLGQLNKETSLTGSYREARIAGSSRPGIVYPLPCAARPDTQLEVDAAPPKAAALNCAERPTTGLDIPETGRLETPHCPESR